MKVGPLEVNEVRLVELGRVVEVQRFMLAC